MGSIQRYSTAVLACAALSSAAVAQAPAAPPDLGQGWSDTDRDFFWFTNQGSRLIPREWFLALEREDGPDLFLADGLARFGYLPAPRGSPNNKYNLPIGFTVDPGKAKPWGASKPREWIGMTCAACHTSVVTSGATRLLVEGAPGEADMYALLVAMNRSLQNTLNDEPTFRRFAARVLRAGDTQAARAQLRDGPDGLRPWLAYFSRFVTDSKPKRAEWGPRRLDAFGMIFNRVTSIDLGIVGNSESPDAPVSYPFLWGTSWHDLTQWTGAVRNDSEDERLGRNFGQVLGVFGMLDLTWRLRGYRSSAVRKNLLALEETVSRLKAPEWPAPVFGVPDAQRVASGRQIYSINCAGCHLMVPRENQLQKVQVTVKKVSEVGTDETMANMAVNRKSATGKLQRRPLEYFSGGPMGPEEHAADILDHAVIGAIVRSVLDPGAPAAPAGPAAAVRSPTRPGPMFATALTEGTYKARPLNGIWATAPYLHNGSVRTLRQLLLPPRGAGEGDRCRTGQPEFREDTFLVGSREFDPQEVGFASAGASWAARPFLFDTSIPGNFNKGHVWGTNFSCDQKRDLLEFMKTL